MSGKEHMSSFAHVGTTGIDDMVTVGETVWAVRSAIRRAKLGRRTSNERSNVSEARGSVRVKIRFLDLAVEDKASEGAADKGALGHVGEMALGKGAMLYIAGRATYK
jgi:hypothetical protein